LSEATIVLSGTTICQGTTYRTVYYLRTQSSNRYPFVSLQVTDEVNVGKTIWVKVIKCEPNMNGKGGWKLSLSMQVRRGLLLLSGTSVCQGRVLVRDCCFVRDYIWSGTSVCQGLHFVREDCLTRDCFCLGTIFAVCQGLHFAICRELNTV